MSSPPVDADSSVRLVPASQLSIKDLTKIYNQTRVDYMVPMPMNMAKMAEYIQNYDIDLQRSFVVIDEGAMIGLGMLGVRPGRAWITRLGILPESRRHGLGRLIMNALLEEAEALNINFTMLEVIKGNLPAHALFLKLGYRAMGELLILRRPPGPPALRPYGKAEWLGRSEAVTLLERRARSGLPPWTNQPESLRNAGDMYGLWVTLPEGGQGWLVFQRQRFMMSRFVMQAEGGDPLEVGRAVLSHLHERFFDLDTHTENIAAADPLLPAYYAHGYFEEFRRLEMYRGEIIL
jgi:ribosomal protein S18 acetylase RimI-like enzyme